jgi:hypothetical protein
MGIMTSQPRKGSEVDVSVLVIAPMSYVKHIALRKKRRLRYIRVEARINTVVDYRDRCIWRPVNLNEVLLGCLGNTDYVIG